MVRSGEIDDITPGEEVQILYKGEYIADNLRAHRILQIGDALRSNSVLGPMIDDHTIMLHVEDGRLQISGDTQLFTGAIKQVLEAEQATDIAALEPDDTQTTDEATVKTQGRLF